MIRKVAPMISAMSMPPTRVKRFRIEAIRVDLPSVGEASGLPRRPECWCLLYRQRSLTKYWSGGRGLGLEDLGAITLRRPIFAQPPHKVAHGRSESLPRAG